VPQVRLSQGRHEEPTLAIIDSRSVKGTSKGGPHRALMGSKESKDSSGISWLTF
jgi:hypothetical protein